MGLRSVDAARASDSSASTSTSPTGVGQLPEVINQLADRGPRCPPNSTTVSTASSGACCWDSAQKTWAASRPENAQPAWGTMPAPPGSAGGSAVSSTADRNSSMSASQARRSAGYHPWRAKNIPCCTVWVLRSMLTSR